MDKPEVRAHRGNVKTTCPDEDTTTQEDSVAIDEQHDADDRRAVDARSAASVDEVLAPLADLDGLPLDNPASVFEDVHAGLHRLLAEPER